MPSRQPKNQTAIDRFYLAEAEAVRALSDDPKAAAFPQSAVGAIIANRAGEIVRSANIVPPRLKTAFARIGRSTSDTERYFLIEHAERAALYKAWEAGHDLTEATLYCTRFPCSDCARAIVWSKMGRLVVAAGFAGEVRWLDTQRAALEILRSSGVKIRYLGNPRAGRD